MLDKCISCINCKSSIILRLAIISQHLPAVKDCLKIYENHCLSWLLFSVIVVSWIYVFSNYPLVGGRVVIDDCWLLLQRDVGDDGPRDIKPPLAPISSAASMVPPPAFSLPMPFPFPPPGAAFLPPFPPQHPTASSASSHSSESSTSSQTAPQVWTFEDQFKQVCQASSIDPCIIYRTWLKSRNHPRLQ